MILAAMVMAPNFYCKNCLRVFSAMRGNPPLVNTGSFAYVDIVFLPMIAQEILFLTIKN